MENPVLCDLDFTIWTSKQDSALLKPEIQSGLRISSVTIKGRSLGLIRGKLFSNSLHNRGTPGFRNIPESGGTYACDSGIKPESRTTSHFAPWVQRGLPALLPPYRRQQGRACALILKILLKPSVVICSFFLINSTTALNSRKLACFWVCRGYFKKWGIITYKISFKLPTEKYATFLYLSNLIFPTPK